MANGLKYMTLYDFLYDLPKYMTLYVYMTAWEPCKCIGADSVVKIRLSPGFQKSKTNRKNLKIKFYLHSHTTTAHTFLTGFPRGHINI